MLWSVGTVLGDLGVFGVWPRRRGRVRAVSPAGVEEEGAGKNEWDMRRQRGLDSGEEPRDKERNQVRQTLKEIEGMTEIRSRGRTGGRRRRRQAVGEKWPRSGKKRKAGGRVGEVEGEEGEEGSKGWRNKEKEGLKSFSPRRWRGGRPPSSPSLWSASAPSGWQTLTTRTNTHAHAHKHKHTGKQIPGLSQSHTKAQLARLRLQMKWNKQPREIVYGNESRRVSVPNPGTHFSHFVPATVCVCACGRESERERESGRVAVHYNAKQMQFQSLREGQSNISLSGFSRSRNETRRRRRFETNTTAAAGMAESTQLWRFI